MIKTIDNGDTMGNIREIVNNNFSKCDEKPTMEDVNSAITDAMENMSYVAGAAYDSTTGEVVLTLNDSTTITFTAVVS